MTVRLKWNGNELMLGKTRMARVREAGVEQVKGPKHDYVVGPDDFTSKPYESADDCRQDAEAHVRRLLAKAGAPDA